jgi:hypothetical protein
LTKTEKNWLWASLAVAVALWWYYGWSPNVSTTETDVPPVDTGGTDVDLGDLEDWL